MKKDTLFEHPFFKDGGFDFNDEVTHVFDDMVQRSVPYYREVQKAIVQTTKKVSFIGEFELFIGLLKGSGLLKVSKLESLSGRYNLKPKPLVCALYVNELIYHLIPDGIESIGLYYLYSQTIHDLELNPVEPVLRNFEQKLLGHLGIYPDLFSDISGKQIHPKLFYTLANHESLVPVIQAHVNAISGKIWIEIGSGAFDEPITNLHGKNLHRILLKKALGGRELNSRHLLLR